MCYKNQRKNMLKKFLSFSGGFVLGQVYYVYLLKKIKFPYIGVMSLVISTMLGVGNMLAIQLRCISLLTIPMYCGKAGRGVLKAVVLTYVVAGPVTNMGLNAREVVRVFACSTELSYNIAKEKYIHTARPIRHTLRDLKSDVDQIKYTLWSLRGTVKPIEAEIETQNETEMSDEEYYDMEDEDHAKSSSEISLLEAGQNPSEEYQKSYLKKVNYRCQNQLDYVPIVCATAFSYSFNSCYQAVPKMAARALCEPVELPYVCNINGILDNHTCSKVHIDPGLGEAYATLKMVKQEFTTKLNSIKLQQPVNFERKLYDIQAVPAPGSGMHISIYQGNEEAQIAKCAFPLPSYTVVYVPDGKETGARVTQAFDEKIAIMQFAITVMDVGIALLFLRILWAAAAYHDTYLTSIGFDNVYITGYFKRLDLRRRKMNNITLLPLKKMERYKYTDVHSLTYISERGLLFTQILKVMLEVVTATTFVMLDRLFYEALDVVRQYAEVETTQQGVRDLDIEVKGIGPLASILRKLLNNLKTSEIHVHPTVTNKQCIPRPRLMPAVFFLKIYGGYLWIILLLCINPYTSRLRRLICSCFYPRREKQRILHLYNDILKKRMKMQKTLRRKAVQAVRAHYLSGENLLSMRMKFPHVLGWLRIFHAARMTCLICGETKPRKVSDKQEQTWHSCCISKCPFVYCTECWFEIGRKCLACDPSLAELSDIDSLSEDENVRY